MQPRALLHNSWAELLVIDYLKGQISHYRDLVRQYSSTPNAEEDQTSLSPISPSHASRPQLEGEGREKASETQNI